jgi:hypothetical protein
MPESHLRAADADRAAVADVLGASLSAGRLTVAEYDDRLARAYAARTYGELAELTTDLPTTAPRPAAASASEPGPQPAPAAACEGSGWAHGRGPWAGHPGLRSAWTTWVSTAVIVVGIWAITSIGSGGWIHPWPLWVIGPWGVVLLARSLGDGPGPGRDRNRDRRAQRQRS